MAGGAHHQSGSAAASLCIKHHSPVDPLSQRLGRHSAMQICSVQQKAAASLARKKSNLQFPPHYNCRPCEMLGVEEDDPGGPRQPASDKAAQNGPTDGVWRRRQLKRRERMVQQADPRPRSSVEPLCWDNRQYWFVFPLIKTCRDSALHGVKVWKFAISQSLIRCSAMRNQLCTRRKVMRGFLRRAGLVVLERL